AAVLPGFGLFRYPAKLLTFAALAVAVLAGAGWDRLAGNAAPTSLPPRRGGAVAAVTLGAPVLAVAAPAPLVAWLRVQLPSEVEFGAVAPHAALSATVRALVHGGSVAMLALALTVLAPRRPRAAGGLALLVMALDLGVAGAPLVWTVPQAEFE